MSPQYPGISALTYVHPLPPKVTDAPLTPAEKDKLLLLTFKYKLGRIFISLLNLNPIYIKEVH